MYLIIIAFRLVCLSLQVLGKEFVDGRPFLHHNRGDDVVEREDEERGDGELREPSCDTLSLGNICQTVPDACVHRWSPSILSASRVP